MKIVEVQFNMWEKPADFFVGEVDLKIGDYVIIETDSALEMGKVIDIKEENKDTIKLEESKSIIRKANLNDFEKLEDYEKRKEGILEICKKLIEKNQLPMKLVDVHSSFDDKKVTFAFISEGRVDFRQLVKDLTRNFQKNIRLQQLGVRDEAKVNGDIGACGIVQCCKTHLKVLGNVGAEQAELQQVSHRGAERLSGICNRLKCCLRYENDLYKELTAKFPALGSQVKTPRGRGEVTEWHILRQAVNVKIEGDTIVEVPLDSIG